MLGKLPCRLLDMKTTDRITKLVLARKPEIGTRGVKRDIANTCGISYEAVRQWFAGDTENIRNENLVALAEGYDTTVDWLLSGKGEPPRRKDQARQALEESNSTPSSAADAVLKMLTKHGKGLPDEARRQIIEAASEPASDMAKPSNVITGNFPRPGQLQNGDVLIPQYDVRAAMGDGQVPAEYIEFVRNVVVDGPELDRIGLGYTSPANLAIISGWGQSMEGTISDKDPVIVDRGVAEFVGDGVYVLTWDKMLYIKRLQKADADHFDMISDNEKHKDRVVHVDEVVIHAKVLAVWNLKKL